jgi:hypothetical protein
MSDLTPYFAGVLEALGRPVAKAFDPKEPRDDAGRWIASPLPLETVKAFMANPKGELPVMKIPGWIATAIGAKTRQVVFSAESMAKNLREHPELEAEEYALLPRLNGNSPGALVIQDRDNACVVIQENGRRYLAAIKATQSGESVFATSFHRLEHPEDLVRKLRRGRIIPPPG